MIDGLKNNIEKSIASFLERIKIEYNLHLVNPILYSSIKEYSLRKGKRLRPLLLILTYKGYSKKKTLQSLYNASTCIEFLHNFMLIHDPCRYGSCSCGVRAPSPTRDIDDASAWCPFRGTLGVLQGR